MPGGRSKGQNETRRRTFAQRIDDARLERAFAAGAVKAFADDDEDPSFAIALRLPNEAMDLALRFSSGLSMQIALGFDFELRVFEGVENAGVRGTSLAEDDAVAFTLDEERFGRGPRRWARRSAADRRSFGSGHHALS
jgi:hypothetical protein